MTGGAMAEGKLLTHILCESSFNDPTSVEGSASSHHLRGPLSALPPTQQRQAPSGTAQRLNCRVVTDVLVSRLLC